MFSTWISPSEGCWWPSSNGAGDRKQMVWNEGGRVCTASVGPDRPRASAGRKAHASFVTFFLLGHSCLQQIVIEHVFAI